MNDKEIELIILDEVKRQKEFVQLIASENFVSNDVLKATGSILTNKYAEGYPGKRYYGGVENADRIENIARDRLKKLFNAKYVNVQPHSGTQANIAVFQALLEPGDKILGMSLTSGGHLSHGFKASSSGKNYTAFTYEVSKENNELDYDEILQIAKKVKPKLIIAGASSYPRKIDFSKFKEIADKVGAYLLADVAHIIGLIVTGNHQNPFDVGVDVVTSTTHKTLRGARGGIILTNDEELSKKIDSAVFPGTQGGPLVHVIAGKAITFKEALEPEFKTYIENVIENSSAMANKFIEKGKVVSTNGTDNHLFLVNTKKSFGLTGKQSEELLWNANIVLNKNVLPFDEESPSITSGIRIGTAAMTTAGLTKNDFIKLADIIIEILDSNSKEIATKKKLEVLKLLGRKYEKFNIN